MLEIGRVAQVRRQQHERALQGLAEWYVHTEGLLLEALTVEIERRVAELGRLGLGLRVTAPSAPRLWVNDASLRFLSVSFEDEVVTAYSVRQAGHALMLHWAWQLRPCRGRFPRILSVLNQRTGGTFQPDDLEDLTQDTLIAFWSRIADYSGQAALETWAYGFCVNGFMSALRRRRNRGGVDSIDEFAVAKVPPASSGSVEYEHVHRGLELLDEKETRVIRLKHFDDLTFEEIGARMRMSPNTAKTCYYRGMRRLE